MKRLCIRGHGYYTGRCSGCERERDARRGSRQQRGYGNAHYKARAALAKTLPTYCGYDPSHWITADTPWVAAHVVDGQPEYGWMVSCVGCNERAKTRIGKVQSTR